jgi:uncharacterized protein involved in propanediol utilization
LHISISSYRFKKGIDGARDRNRTSDTRIFNPSLSFQNQELSFLRLSNPSPNINGLELDCQTVAQRFEPPDPQKETPAKAATFEGANQQIRIKTSEKNNSTTCTATTISMMATSNISNGQHLQSEAQHGY